MDFKFPNDPQSQQFSERFPIKVLLNKCTHSCGILSCPQVNTKLMQKWVWLLGSSRSTGGHGGFSLSALQMRWTIAAVPLKWERSSCNTDLSKTSKMFTWRVGS